MADPFYEWLLSGGEAGDPFDRHVFACALAIAYSGVPDPCQPLPAHQLGIGLGLDQKSLSRLLCRYFPDALSVLSGVAPPPNAIAEIEEDDLRALLLEHRGSDREEEEWLASIIARRSVQPNHLWQDLGLFSRADLSALMSRHFPALAEKNNGNMKWKKFFYRALCEQEEVMICKSPHCEVCDDFAQCFGDEPGRAFLLAPQAIQSL